MRNTKIKEILPTQYKKWERINKGELRVGNETNKRFCQPWTCIPYIQGKGKAIKKILKRTKQKSNVNFYVPTNCRKEFYTCPKDKVDKLQSWNCIARVLCRNCKNMYVIPITGKMSLKMVLKDRTNAIHKHMRKENHQLDTKKTTIRPIRRGYTVDTMAAIIVNRLKMTYQHRKIFMIRQGEHSRVILKITLHKRLNHEITKIHENLLQNEM